MQYIPVNATETCYAELRQAYDVFNAKLFDGRLPGCLITLQREKRTCGYFSANRFANRSGTKADEIAINPEYFAVTPLLETLQTVVHEMAHQWQQQFGDPGRGRYHNQEWAQKMESIGLMPSDTGAPGGRKTGDRMADYPIAGGRFLAVVNELVASNFGISWYDRYPTHRPAATAVTSDFADSVDSRAFAVMVPPEKIQTMTAQPSQASNRSLRSKYSCPSCSISVWGKPSLQGKLGCFECQQPLMAA